MITTPTQTPTEIEDPRPKVMVIDDEAGFTKLLKLAIRKYRFCEVNDSAQALRKAREFLPDVILLDVIMPGADGGDLAARLRRDPLLFHIPIVFVTAIVSTDETAKGTMGGYDFFPKPVDPKKLIEKIDGLLAAKAKPKVAASSAVIAESAEAEQ